MQQIFGATMTIIQTNPDAFGKHRPIHTVTHIDRAKGIVTMTGSDCSTFTAPLNAWGRLIETQPVVGSKVQLLEEQ
jgi:hypothetical protein